MEQRLAEKKDRSSPQWLNISVCAPSFLKERANSTSEWHHLVVSEHRCIAASYSPRWPLSTATLKPPESVRVVRGQKAFSVNVDFSSQQTQKSPHVGYCWLHFDLALNLWAANVCRFNLKEMYCYASLYSASSTGIRTTKLGSISALPRAAEPSALTVLLREMWADSVWDCR